MGVKHFVLDITTIVHFNFLFISLFNFLFYFILQLAKV